MFLFNKKTTWALCAFCLFGIHTHAQMKLTLDEALAYSLEHSPDMKNVTYNLERYKLNLVAQKASLKSRFALTLNPLSYSRSRNFQDWSSQWYTNESFSSAGTFSISQPIVWTGATVSLNNRFNWQFNESSQNHSTNRSFTNDLYLSISQPLFTYNSLKMDLKNMEYDYENALINYALRKMSLETSITSQFYNVYTAGNNLEISREELKNAEQNYNIIKNKVEADLSARDELYQAELNLANANSTVDNRIVSLENAKDDLKKTLGIPLSTELEISTEVNVTPVIIDLEKAIQNAISSRLELRQREISREQLDMQMKQVKKTNSFNGDLSLSVGIIGDNEHLRDLYDAPTKNPRVSLSLNVPIFDWGARKARIKAQEIAIEMHEYETQEELKAMEIAIRKCYRSLNNLATQIAIAEQSLKNAKLTYELNSLRYRNGDLTGMEMSQFQTQLSNQQMSYISTLISYRLELLNLKTLTLYDFEKGESIVPLKDVPTDDM